MFHTAKEASSFNLTRTDEILCYEVNEIDSFFKSTRGKVLEIINLPGVREGSETKPDRESALPFPFYACQVEEAASFFFCWFTFFSKVEGPFRTDYNTIQIKGGTLCSRLEYKIH